MVTLNSVCDTHGHDPGLPDRVLRGHVLAAAIRAAQRVLSAHGYGDPERSLEILHIAIEDAEDDTDAAADEPQLMTSPPALVAVVGQRTKGWTTAAGVMTPRGRAGGRRRSPARFARVRPEAHSSERGTPDGADLSG